MTNTTTEIKNTGEEISSRVNEAEKQVSKLENRILEITAVEQKTEKKEMITVSDTSGTTLNTLPFASGVLEGPEKMFEEITAENSPNMGKETVTQVQEVQSHIQDKPKGEHTKTYNNQIDKN